MISLLHKNFFAHCLIGAKLILIRIFVSVPSFLVGSNQAEYINCISKQIKGHLGLVPMAFFAYLAYLVRPICVINLIITIQGYKKLQHPLTFIQLGKIISGSILRGCPVGTRRTPE